MNVIVAPKPFAPETMIEEAVAAFVGQAKAATPAQRALVVARLRRMIASDEAPVYKEHKIPTTAMERVVAAIEALR